MFKNNLARILSDKKKLEKISQAQIAREVGVSPSNITEWVKGRGSPGPEKLKILAEVLGVSLADLVGESPFNSSPGWVTIPILGEVPAGNPIEAVECREGNFSLPAHIARRVDFGLRHVTATYLLAAGVPLRDVMQIMGWTRIDTAQRYIHLANDAAEQIAKLPY